jgi:hypothetical protein
MRGRQEGRAPEVTHMRGGDEGCIILEIRSHGGQHLWWEAVSP